MAAPQRSALFIDGANLYATTKALGFDIDYKKLLKEFQARDNLLRAFYYTAMIEDQEYSSIRPLIDWLDYNGYRVVTKPVKEFTDSMGRRKYKGNMDIELAIDMMEIAPNVDHVVLFSGDGDFRRLVEAVQRRGLRVTVVSTIRSQPPMIADELRRQADLFIELQDLAPEIARARDPNRDVQRDNQAPPEGYGDQGVEDDEGEDDGVGNMAAEDDGEFEPQRPYNDRGVGDRNGGYGERPYPNRGGYQGNGGGRYRRG